MSSVQRVRLCLLFAVTLFCGSAGAFTVDVVEVNGRVGYGRQAKGPWAEVTKGMTLEEGMFVRTGDDAKAVLKFQGQAAVTIHERTQIYLKKFEQKDDKPRSLVLLLFGKLWAKVKKATDGEDQFVISTPAAIAAVRGTEFFVESDPQTRNATIGVWEGEVGVYAQNDEQRQAGVGVKAGFMIEVLYNKPPSRDALLKMEAAREREKQQFNDQINGLGLTSILAPGAGQMAQLEEERTAQARDDIVNMNREKRAKAKAEEDFNKLERALGQLYADTEFVPGKGKRKTSDKSKTLLCLIQNDDGNGKEIPGWKGPYIDSDLKDPWGETYGVYQPRPTGIMLHSCGPDKGRGNDDDFESYVSLNNLKKAAGN